MTRPPRLLLRADGGAHLGTGHVMRCLALAHAWRQGGGTALLATADCSPALERRLQTEGIDVTRLDAIAGSATDATQTIALATSLDTAWLVADGYAFGADFQQRIKAAGRRLLLFDDYGHASHYPADLVVNQNLGADAGLYSSREPSTRLLLGARYIQLREQFWQWRSWRRDIAEHAGKVLVTLGGADPESVSGTVIQALLDLDVETRVVIGGSNPHIDSWASVAHPRLAIIRDAANMPELMAWADLGVAAGGTTSYELAFMGLPAVLLVVAENQRRVAEALDHHGVAHQVELPHLRAAVAALLPNRDRRLQMSQRGRQTVDGRGSERVATRLRAEDLLLQPAAPEDCRRLWEWANDPEVRAVSFAPAAIPWEDHQRWYQARLADASCRFYVARNSPDDPIGQIRYQVAGAEAVVSVSVARPHRGQGYGAALIARGSEQLFRDTTVAAIHAYIKAGNESSLGAFARADYDDAGPCEVQGQPARHYIRHREAAL